MQRASRAVLRETVGAARAAGAKHAASASLVVPHLAAPVARSNTSLLVHKTRLPDPSRFFSSTTPVSGAVQAAAAQAGSNGRRSWRSRSIFAAGCVIGGVCAASILVYTVLRAMYHRIDDKAANYLVEESLEIIEKNEKVASRLGTPLVGHGPLALIRHREEHAKTEDEDSEPRCIYLMYKLTGPNGDATVLAEVVKDKYNSLVVVFDDTKDFVKILD